MAVKKKVDKAVEAEVKVDVQVETPVEEVQEDVIETNEGEESADKTPEVEIEEEKAEVNVDLDNATVNTSNKPDGKVKIKMRVDHRCTIAMERYDLVAGKTYIVPRNVKNILNKAGLLAPL